MTLPAFMNPQPAPAAAGGASRIGGGPPAFANFFFVGQELSLWCWAAVGAAISASKGRPTQQCRVATAYGLHSGVPYIQQALTSRPCCPPGEDVDVSGELDVALTSIGLPCTAEDVDATTASRVPADLAANQAPLGVFIRWGPDSGHFIAIVGIDENDGSFQIYDPSDLHQNSSYFVSRNPSYLSDYDGAGSWDGIYRLT